MGLFQEIKQRFTQDPKKIPDELETLEEYKLRWRSIYIIYFTMFLMSLGFSIVLTGVWPYLDKLDPTAGKTFMGYVVGANPFAQMIFSPIVGWWSNKQGSIRLPLLVTLLIFALANCVYSSLELFTSHRKYWMLASRCLVGLSSANVAAIRSYLSAATRLSERRKAISMLSLAQVLGFIVGPAVQAAFVPFGNDGFWLIPAHLKLNMYTAAGWLNVLLALANFALFLPGVFSERKIALQETNLLLSKSPGQTTKETSVNHLTAWSLITFHFVLVFNFMIMETLGSSVAMDQFGFTKAEAIGFMGVMMSVGAFLSCICFVVIHPLCRRFGEMNVMIWGGFFLMSVGRFLYLPLGSEPALIYEENDKLAMLEMVQACRDNITNSNSVGFSQEELEDVGFLNEYCGYKEVIGCPSSQVWCKSTNKIVLPQFVVGSVIGTIGFPLGLTLLQTSFSKILGSRPQGVWMGYMTGSGSLSRVLGPVLMTFIYTRYGPNWTFGVTTVMLAVSTIYLLVFSDHFTTLDKSNCKSNKSSNNKIVVRISEEEEKLNSDNNDKFTERLTKG